MFPLKTDEVYDRSADSSKKEIEKLTLKPTSVIAQILGACDTNSLKLDAQRWTNTAPEGKSLLFFHFV